MANQKTQFVAVNALLHGWGYVEGRWVYVPLWDPPYEFHAVRQMIAANAIADAAKLLANKDMSARLHSLAGGLLKKSFDGMLKAWEDGDPICPPWPFPRWPFPWPPIPWPYPWPHPWPGPGPDPGPLDKFFESLNPMARTAVTGSLVSQIGEMLNDKEIISTGIDIMQSR